MNKIIINFLGLINLLVLPSFCQEESGFKAWWNGFDSAAAEHLEIGTRITYFTFKDFHGDFVGTVNTMQARQNMDPVKIFLDWKFNSFIGMEVTWDRVAFNTITTWNTPIGSHNDGTFKLMGPMLSVFGRFPNDTRFTPYAGVGIVYFNHTEVTKGWWHHGFSGSSIEEINEKYEAWREAGSPQWPNGGYQRTFDPEDSLTGSVFTGGCCIKLFSHVSGDLYIRYTHAVVDFDFTLSNHGLITRLSQEEFDISNLACGMGLKYVF